jgi:general stress protein 26
MSQSNAADVKTQLLGIVRTINKTCVRGTGFAELAPFFHPAAAIPTRDFATRVRGPDMCLRYYEDACSQMTFRRLDTSDEQVDAFGPAAVLSHKYSSTWEHQGKRHEVEGREILVFVQDGGAWKIAWRTLIPGVRQTEVCPAEGPDAGFQLSDNIRQTCRSLMAAMSVCYLTTLDADGFPHTTGMNNLRCVREYPDLVDFHAEHGDFTLFVSTAMQSDKIARIRANPRVSVYFCDPGQIVGFMLGGEIEIVEDRRIKDRLWQKGWTLYYPNGPEGPEYGILKLVPKTVKGWCQTGSFELTLTQEGENHV